MKRRSLFAAGVSAPALLLRGNEPKPEKLKYLQIGIGHPHANKIRQYADSDNWEVVGIVEEDPELRQKAAEDKTYRDFPLLTLEQGLNHPKLDAIGVETEIGQLLKYAEMAIDAGCHVHLDKPAGADLEHYQKIMQKADDKNLVVQMGYMYRFNPAVLLLHRMIKAGWLGEIFETHAVMSKVIDPKSRQVIDDFAGGTMFELGCHIIDLTIGVLGKPDKVNPYPRRVIESDQDSLVDNMLAVFEYPKATASVRSTGVEVEGFSRRHFSVCGTEGTVHIQPLDRPIMKVSLSKQRSFDNEERIFKKGYTEINFGPYKRYAGDVEDLAKVIRGEKENSYPSSHDLAVQQAVLLASEM